MPNPSSTRMKLTLMKAIADLASDKGWTQTELAKLLGTHQPRISNLVTLQEHLFGLDWIMLSARKLGIQFEVFVTDPNGALVCSSATPDTKES